MDASLYHDLKVSRGLTYHYYLSPPKESKPWLLFLHGFPSSSYDWNHQVTFFKGEGFGLLVPDLLGYGGTSKPTEVADYKASLICKDVIDILDKENITTAVAIGHDWGSHVASRLYNYHPDRFSAFGFLSVWYIVPDTEFDYEKALVQTKAMFGYELIGYWEFFSEEGADKVIESHPDSFFNLLWPNDPAIWKTEVAPRGAIKAAILGGKELPKASWLSDEDRKIQSKILFDGGLAGPLNWYKLRIQGIDAEENKQIPKEKYMLTKPSFYGAAKHDYIALMGMGKLLTSQSCTDATVKEFDAGHWLQAEAAEEVNKELLAWLGQIQAKL